MKQGLHEVISVEKQVLIFYALTHGFLDTIRTSELGRFEREFYDFVDNQHQEILTEINETKELPDSGKIEAIITEFIDSFFTSTIDSDSSDYMPET